ncbi:hypothetical protein B0T20DRAFT_247538 [Sordaria brevicollis]|uniref:Uncharacterized protein n=1 Tax=Sordaria brevicollis TaxID=83679 RepID=A0AAE0UB30_SORBR|nr:hypothetical protein B0T20DRAFT_247538 [Sordaria brevicollis]
MFLVLTLTMMMTRYAALFLWGRYINSVGSFVKYRTPDSPQTEKDGTYIFKCLCRTVQVSLWLVCDDQRGRRGIGRSNQLPTAREAKKEQRQIFDVSQGDRILAYPHPPLGLNKISFPSGYGSSMMTLACLGLTLDGVEEKRLV